jgi:hypothetical protein
MGTTFYFTMPLAPPAEDRPRDSSLRS